MGNNNKKKTFNELRTRSFFLQDHSRLPRDADDFGGGAEGLRHFLVQSERASIVCGEWFVVILFLKCHKLYQRVPKEMGRDFRVADPSWVYRRSAELPGSLYAVPRRIRL